MSKQTMKSMNPQNYKKWIQRLCLIISYLFAIIFLLLLLNNYINKHLKQQLISSLEDLAHQNITFIQNNVEQHFSFLDNLAKQIGNDENYDVIQSAKETKKIAEIFGFREIGIALPDGTAYMSTDTVFNISTREYFKQGLQGKHYVSNILTDMRDQADVNVYSVPIKNKEDTIIGVLFGIDNTNNFFTSFQVSTFHDQGYTYIIDSDGNVIGSSFQYQEFAMTNIFKNLNRYPKQNKQAIQDLRDGINNNTGGSLYYNNYGYRYAVFRSLNMNDWWLITVVPESVLQDRVQPIRAGVQLLYSILFVLLIFIFVYILTKQIKNEKYLKKIAYTNSLTNLYNKAYLQDNFALATQKREPKYAALVLYNIRKFKMINEIYSPTVGNELLKQLGTILNTTKKYAREIVIHDHADVFAALYFFEERSELEHRIQDFLEKIHVIDYSNTQITINMAVGIYEIQDLSYPFEKIYNYATIANNQNKTVRSGILTYYSEELGENEIKKKCLDDNIREGIQKKEFRAWFQPKFDCHTQELVGCEALARWYKEDGTVLTPYHFIELSEKLGLIRDIDELIFEDVCKKIKEWELQGFTCIPISVNLSRAYLNSLNAIDHLKKILDKYEISSEYIQLEITESSIVDNEQQLNDIISKMHSFGFKVLLDDFGIGYSSLMSINSLNFDTLKIDKSFVDAIGSKNGDFIIQYTIQLGRKLGMEVLVEGVETEKQYEFLKEQNCDVIQGYYFSKPLCDTEFEQLLHKNQN